MKPRKCWGLLLIGIFFEGLPLVLWWNNEEARGEVGKDEKGVGVVLVECC